MSLRHAISVLVVAGSATGLLATSCGPFSSAVWPIVTKCAPEPVALISQVASILLAGGDYQAALLAVAETVGKDAVVCAVRELLAKWNAPSATSEERTSTYEARQRAAEFLNATGN